MRWDLVVQPVRENPLKLKEYFFSLLPHQEKTPNNPKPLYKVSGACTLLSSVRTALQVPTWPEKRQDFLRNLRGMRWCAPTEVMPVGRTEIFPLSRKLYQLGTSTLFFIFPKESNTYCSSFFSGWWKRDISPDLCISADNTTLKFTNKPLGP